ncbi:MAG: hypothetical protein ACREMN_09445 [Gemmatimonadales bacterium]
MGRAWLPAAVLHIVAVVLFVTVPWQAPRPEPEFILLPPVDTGGPVYYVPGARETPSRGPSVVTSRREPEAPAAPPPPPTAAPSPPDTALTMPAYDPDAERVAPAPAVGDGRLWVSPRPPLPAAVAEALYGDSTERHAAAIGRLRAMVDSLNQVLDQIQRNQQRPSWTIGGEDGGLPKFGIDSQYIHVAGIKIPTLALALLGDLLPAGNFDETMRNRQLHEMRVDLLHAADRAQSFQDFRRYVRELRARKQAERDAERRRRQPPDTVQVIP